MDNALDTLRRETSPLFNDRKLKLGTFSSNLSGGCAITTIDGTLEVTWPNTLTLGRLADEMEFEALVPVGRWRGFGGPTNFNGAGFECFLLGGRHGGLHQILRRVRHLARAHDPPDHGGKAGGDDRPHQRRPFRAQRRHRLAQARDRDVWRTADRARCAL